MRWAGRQIRRLAILIALFGLLHLVTMASADRTRMAGHGIGTRIWVIDHGYHSGVIIAASDLRRAAVEIGRGDAKAGQRLRWLASRFPQADWLEIGWGDAAFYQQTPSVSDVDLVLAAQALFWPTEAVLQVVPGWGAPETGFAGAETFAIDLRPEGVRGLAARLADTVPEPAPAVGLGPSLYGSGVFYPAKLDYHLFRTCNHWVAWLLRGAGVPASPLPGTFSAGLMAELRWRVPSHQ